MIKVKLVRNRMTGNYKVESIVGALSVCDGRIKVVYPGEWLTEKGAQELCNRDRVYTVTVVGEKE